MQSLNGAYSMVSSSPTISASALNTSHLPASSTTGHVSSPEVADINLFNSELDNVSRASASSAVKTPEQGTDRLSGYLESFQKTSEHFNSSLAKVARDPAPANMLESMHDISRFDIQSRLMAKMVGSGVKGLDKLTSMQ